MTLTQAVVLFLAFPPAAGIVLVLAHWLMRRSRRPS